MKKLSFKEVYEKLQYIDIEDTPEKTTDEVCEEIRNLIRSYGWKCADFDYDEEDWLKDHPEISKADCADYAISEEDFLCDNEGFFERINGHDFDYYTFKVSFYGIWIDGHTDRNDGIFFVGVN